MKAHRFKCPECGADVFSAHPRQQFCTPKHSKDYSNRQLKRGQRLASLAQAWRLSRGRKDDESRSSASFAFAQFCRLLDQFNAEDREAGRVDALRVFQRRMAAGLLDL